MAIPLGVAVLLFATGFYVLRSIVSSSIASRRNAAKARALKCEEPPFEKNRWPLGIDNLRRTLQADKNDRIPQDVVERFEALGTYTYVYEILGDRNLHTADPRNIQAILATQFADFDTGPVRRACFFPLLGDGIFTADGDRWKHSRALLRPQFSRDQVGDLELEETHVQNLMRLLEPMITADGWIHEVDLQPYFFRLTLDVSTEFLFGESVNSQLQLLPGHQSSKMGSVDSRLASAFDTAQRGLANRIRFANLYWLHNPKEFRDACKIVHDFVDHFVRLALSKPQDREKDGEKYIFLDALVAETRDPIELRSELLHILLAGRDTTAAHLGWVFHNLSRDPARYQKLRATILEDFGTYNHPRNLTFAKLKDCKYLRWVNDESLRLSPLVPMNGRYANKDTTIPTGGGPDGKSPIFVPKGTSVNYSVHMMHRRKDIWGEDADEFRPERWEGRKPGWEYLPFNGGPRICIGQQFALTEASYVTVRLLQRFDRMESLLGNHERVRNHVTLINTVGNGVRVRLHAAAA